MKTMTKLSLVAGLALASCTSASAYDLKGAFENAKVSGEMKVMYFDETQTSTKDDQITAIGGKLSFETGKVEGLYGKLTFQTSHILDYSNSAANIFKKDMDASGSVLSESYLGYKMNDNFAKIGRQFIKTPLVAGSGSRMIKDSFEAILAGTTVANTTIVAGHVSKYANRTDQAGAPGKFIEIENGKDGAITLYAENKSVENLKIRAQYAVLQDDKDLSIMYTDAAYKLGDTKLSVQYGISDNDANTDKGTLLGLKIDQKIDALTLSAAYNTAGDKEDYESGLGEGAHYAFTKLSVGSGKNAYKATADSMMIQAAYKMGDLKLAAAHAKYETDTTDYTEQEVSAKYKFSKQSYLAASYTTFGGAGNETRYDTETRLTLGYKF